MTVHTLSFVPVTSMLELEQVLTNIRQLNRILVRVDGSALYELQSVSYDDAAMVVYGDVDTTKPVQL